MNLPITITQDDLLEILLNVAPSRPVFIWGAPGIGNLHLWNNLHLKSACLCIASRQSASTGRYYRYSADQR